MGFIQNVKKSFRLLFSPGKESAAKMDIIGALKFYYGASLIPVLLFIVLGYIALQSKLLNNILGMVPIGSSLILNAGVNLLLVGFAVVYFWLLVPIGFFINSALYQLVGKHFLRIFKGNYENTFTALVFGSMPLLLLYWLFVIPGINLLALVVLPVWALVAEVIALSVQQRITRLQSAATMAVLAALAVLVVLLVFYAGMLVFNMIPVVAH
jgi:hypothetical protein